MILQFTKMHGLGNDFVVFDAVRQSVHLSTEQIRAIADRNFGIGCDQLLLVERPSNPDKDFRYRIFNADGGEVEQCGNGARCFARFVRDQDLTDKDRIAVETDAGPIELQIEGDGQVTVDMGEPRLTPADIPFEAESLSAAYAIHVDGEQLEIGAVSMGNPHCVLLVDDVDSAPVDTLGAALEAHPRFPNRANIGFLQILDRRHARLRVFERGVGETLACGTGACAAMVSGKLRGLLDDEVSIELPGGSLRIRWPGEGHSVMMTGPATRVFEGSIEL